MSLLDDLHQICIEKGVSIAVAESCTSGLIASKLSQKPGSSTFFKGGVVAYQNEIKANVLGVSQLVIDKKTEVSSEVVTQMAEGVKKSFSSDYSVATTGYAGPTGEANNNPIGTVFIAISNSVNTKVERFVFSGDRQSVVNQSSEKSLELLYSAIKKQK
ncbi:MAG: CinA family protein [Flavobacteriales bacterium]|nr:CinA family protein [Flavobacteriales bacterium]